MAWHVADVTDRKKGLRRDVSAQSFFYYSVLYGVAVAVEIVVPPVPVPVPFPVPPLFCQ